MRIVAFISGVPGGIRTHDLLLRRQTLYPAELRVQQKKHAYNIYRDGLNASQQGAFFQGEAPC